VNLSPETAEGRLLRRPMYENSAMTNITTVGALFLIYGDFSRFVIVDRIGLTIELIPHLFDTTNNWPTGQRGLYCYFRNSSKVIDADAFRVLIGLA
jgi:HK97 family phage major capsid protein